jgi:hypothetical protein
MDDDGRCSRDLSKCSLVLAELRMANLTYAHISFKLLVVATSVQVVAYLERHALSQCSLI